MSLQVRPIAAADRAAWQPLWEEYLDFYEADLHKKVTEETFRRVSGGHPAFRGWLAELDGRAVGFAHVVIGPNTWSPFDDAYLEDLGVAEGMRGRGIGHALISTIRREGDAAGWRRLHWITNAGNRRARRLYDDVAKLTDHVRYEIDL